MSKKIKTRLGSSAYDYPYTFMNLIKKEGSVNFLRDK